MATGLSSPIGHALQEIMGPPWEFLGISREAHRPGAWLQADLAQPGQAAGALREYLAAGGGGPVHGFVHMAGAVFSDKAEATTGFEWEQTLAVNLRAAFELAVALKPYLAPGAGVVWVSSVDAHMASEAGPAAAYGAAKAGLHGLMRQLAAEWGPAFAVRVNSVRLGAIGAGTGAMDEGTLSRLLPRISLRKLGCAHDAAEAVKFLLDPRTSGYVTGVELAVDGGLNIAY